MKSTSGVRRLWLRSFQARLVLPLYSAISGASCEEVILVRSPMRLLNLRLQIAVEWLHDCCHAVLPCCVAMLCCHAVLPCCVAMCVERFGFAS